MQYRRLGRSELMVGEVGLGTATLAGEPRDAAVAAIEAALDAGVSLIEVAIADAAALDLVADALGRQRAHVSLVGVGGGDLAEVQAALARLGTDAFDCFLLDDPDANLTPVHMLGFDGLARSIGLATEEPERALAAILDGSVDVVQVPLNVLELARPAGVDAVLNAAQAADVGVVGCSPLLGGRLGSSGDAALLGPLAFLAQDAPRSVAQGAIAWALSEPRLGAVLAGPRTEAQALEAAAASRLAPLAPDLLERIASAVHAVA